MNCLIKQPAGLGDVLLCQKIAHKFGNEGYNVFWPLSPHYSYLPEYILTHERVQFTSEIPDQIDLIVPLETASHQFENPNDPFLTLAAKFIISDCSFENWADFFHIKRNREREDILYYDILGLKDDSEYIFVNRNFASPPGSLMANMPQFQGHTIEMQFFGWDRIFDWLKVIECASEIHTVQTSIQVILEKVELRAKTVKIYPRTGYHVDFSYAKPFYTRHNWEYIEH